jgi:hypothetical protein
LISSIFLLLVKYYKPFITCECVFNFISTA